MPKQCLNPITMIPSLHLYPREVEDVQTMLELNSSHLQFALVCEGDGGQTMSK